MGVSRETGGSLADLGAALRALDGRGYKAYKEIEGRYAGPGFALVLDHAQGDPFADPSRFRALLTPAEAGLPEWAVATVTRRRATADFLNRRLHAELAARSHELGSGASGRLEILRPGQEVLARASMTVQEEGGMEARFRVGLPARGRRILGREAAELVTEAVAEAVAAAVGPDGMDLTALRRQVETVEDSVELRHRLAEAGLVAFVADGALLPRRSGVDDRPLAVERAIPFEAPESARVSLTAPNAGKVRGLGIPRGVTLIVGGGYHGKSTLLRAIERGVYDHIPGDGRERVVTDPGAVKVRAEDGRQVAGTDISNFIDGLPDGTDTRRFITYNASGSTSQAAAIMEALEVGATTLLLDEDTSATNFMIRDARMQRLIGAADEPITPFIDRARELADEQGVSTIVVVGGSGDYFDVADRVLAMRGYRPAEVTAEARAVATALPAARSREGSAWAAPGPRVPDPGSVDPSRDHRPLAIRILARDRVQFGRELVDLVGLEQLVESAQTRALAFAVAGARGREMDGERTIAEVVGEVVEAMRARGPGWFHPHGIGELAEFRPFELAAFINRIRTLRTHPTRRANHG